jgi:SAM-dependent methyltransferase
MVRRLAERLKPYPGCSAEVMDALNLQCGDNEFDAAFSIFGVLYLGTESVKALSEMARVVRPGGVVGVVHWADPMGGPIFKPVAQAINRMNDPDVGKFADPITEYLEGSEIESALREVGCVDVRSEIVQVDCSMPSPELFMDELDPIFRMHPQYLAAVSRDREGFRMILAEEACLLEAGEYGGSAARANIACARVPAMSRGLS